MFGPTTGWNLSNMVTAAVEEEACWPLKIAVSATCQGGVLGKYDEQKIRFQAKKNSNTIAELEYLLAFISVLILLLIRVTLKLNHAYDINLIVYKRSSCRW